MNEKEFKSYKKELKRQPIHKKISNALEATKHVFQKKQETESKITEGRSKRHIEMLKKMR